MTVPITIGRKTTRALVDTGAVYSLIDKSWLESLQIEYDACDVEVCGFGQNERLNIVGSVILLVSVHGMNMNPVKFYVLDSLRSREVKVILGENFLQENNLSIDIRNFILTKPTKRGSVSIIMKEEEECKVVYKRVECFAKSVAVIAPGQLSQIEIEFEHANVQGGCERCESTRGQIMLVESDSRDPVKIFPGLYGSDDVCASVLVQSSVSRKEKIMKGKSVGVISTVAVPTEPKAGDEVQVGVTALRSEGSSESMFDIREGVDLSHMDCDKQERIYKMLEGVAGAFSRGDCDMGQLNVAPHDIDLTDAFPIYQKPRRFNDQVTESISKQCRELELLDIIEPSKSAWSSPVVPILKKDGTLRLCVDYRKLNLVTKPDRYPIPNLTDNVYSLSEMKFFTTLDLVRGYYQLPLAEDSREYTAFSTPAGLFQFKRLPFGLRNAPAAFQRAMQADHSGIF